MNLFKKKKVHLERKITNKIDSKIHELKKDNNEEKIDAQIEESIKKYPRRDRNKLRALYGEYKKGNVLIPEGIKEKKK